MEQPAETTTLWRPVGPAEFAFSLLLLILLALPCRADQLSTKEQAVDYLKSLPTETKLFVVPTRLLTYEIVGNSNVLNLNDVISEYNRDHPEISLLQFPFSTSLTSIYLYDKDKDGMGYLDQFKSDSKLPDSYKEYLASRQMDYEGCVFTSFLSRDTWTDAGVVFVDKSRLPGSETQRECIEAGLDYINGFPAAPHFDYRKYPPPQVRRLVIEAEYECSTEGSSSERTKDGLTPLPEMACVIGKLSH